MKEFLVCFIAMMCFGMSVYGGNTIHVHASTLGETSVNEHEIPIELAFYNDSGTYTISFNMVGFSNDKYLYQMGGNIYDKQNHISLPTTWTETGSTITAEFTITNTTSRLSLGEGGTYIEIGEPGFGTRLIMNVTLQKKTAYIPA